MKIRKYEGSNETEAMLKVKEELGSDALIVSVKNIRPRGLFKLFKKPYVEVTAALDDRSVLDDSDRPPILTGNQAIVKEPIMAKTEEDEGVYLERFKDLVQNLPEPEPEPEKKQPDKDKTKAKQGPEPKNDVEVINADLIKAVYSQLIDNEVREEIVNQLTAGVEQVGAEGEDELTDVISVIYKRIVTMLSDNEPIGSNTPKTVFFIGPTGVGKTTTIAKVASYFTLNMGKKVALVTSDTYRIAAVEQLRTYANILNIPINVVYTKEELHQAIQDFEGMDLILVDTAGRSHKNSDHQEELASLLEEVPNKEVYLVLSVTTKYKDLINIARRYEAMVDFKVIFTKLDETSCYGNILNIKAETGAKLAYVTFGQNVPDDISEINPHEIARQVLGGEG